jgi:hypothetical protein
VTVSLTQQQKYNRGLLPQLTSPSDTRIRYSLKSTQTGPKMGGGGGGGGASVAARTQAPTSTKPQPGWATGYSGPMIDLGGDQSAWGGMIGGDYGVQEMESMMNAKKGRMEGDLRSQLRQGLIDLGVTDISKLGSLGKYIDEDTISKAAQNKYSRFAQIEQGVNAKQANSQADLAARGLLSSGQLTTDTENSIAEGEQARYSGIRDYASAGQQGLTQIADANEQMAMQLAQARADAAARAAETYWRQQSMSQGRIKGVTDSAGLNPGDPGYQAPGLWDPGYVGTNPVGATGANGQQAAGVQDLINQGVLDYEGLKNLGYTPPPWYTG